MDLPFQTSPGASATPRRPTPVPPREKTKKSVQGETCPRKEPKEVAEQGFGWQKKLEEVGKKQAVADLNTQRH